MKNVEYIKFIKQIQTLYLSAEEIRKVVAAAVATVLAYRAYLPTSPYNEKHEEELNYIQTILPGVKEQISDMNESFVFDTKFAIELTNQIYRARYHMVFPNLERDSRPFEDHEEVKGDFFCSASRIKHHVSYENWLFLTEKQIPILFLVQDLYRALKAEEEKILPQENIEEDADIINE